MTRLHEALEPFPAQDENGYDKAWLDKALPRARAQVATGLRETAAANPDNMFLMVYLLYYENCPFLLGIAERAQMTALFRTASQQLREQIGGNPNHTARTIWNIAEREGTGF